MNYSQDMTEGKLRSLLESTLTEHSQRCLHSPEFTVTRGMEEEASLLMSCPVSANVPGKDPCLDPWLTYIGRNHKSVDPWVCVAVFSQNSLEMALPLTTSNHKREVPKYTPKLLD